MMKLVVITIASLLYSFTKPYTRLQFRTGLVLAMFVFALCGCAALPMPMQPVNEQYNSNEAEGTWLVLDAVDTAYTMHLKKGTECDHEGDPIAAHIYGSTRPPPGRVLSINLVLALGHTMVTSWLDDKVAEHDQKDDGSAGVWYVGRIVWHALSLGYTGEGVYEGHSHGCSL